MLFLSIPFGWLGWNADSPTVGLAVFVSLVVLGILAIWFDPRRSRAPKS